MCQSKSYDLIMESISDPAERTQALIDRYLDLDEFTGNRTLQERREMEQIAEGLMPYLTRIRDAVINHRAQRADDRCWLDDIELYASLKDGIEPDNHVGDKEAMLKNCARFIENRCAGGVWPTYAEIESLLADVRSIMANTRQLIEAYRAKRAIDGGGGTTTQIKARPWKAAQHYQADLLIEQLESKLSTPGVDHGTKNRKR